MKKTMEITRETDFCGKPREEIQYLYIPNGTKVIGEKAFAGCRKLEHLLMPIGLEKIEANAFEGCDSLKELRLIGPVKVDDAAFTGSSIRTLIVDEECRELFNKFYALNENMEMKYVPNLLQRCLFSHGETEILAHTEEEILRAEAEEAAEEAAAEEENREEVKN